MMNGKEPSVSTTALAGIQSLADLLLELPLPSPLPGVIGQQSLLAHLRDPEESRRLLNTQEPILVPQLVDALGHTTTDHIDVKYSDGGVHRGPVPNLVQHLVTVNPRLFHAGFQNSQDLHSQQRMPGCANPVIHPSGAPAMSPYQQPSQSNSPGYFPLELPQTPQPRITQNKTQNAMPPKSPVAYSPFPAHSLHHLPQGALDSLPSGGLQDNQQIFDSPLSIRSIIDVPQPSPSMNTYNNVNCVDGGALNRNIPHHQMQPQHLIHPGSSPGSGYAHINQNDTRTENHVMNSAMTNAQFAQPNTNIMPSPTVMPGLVNSSPHLDQHPQMNMNIQPMKQHDQQWQQPQQPNNAFVEVPQQQQNSLQNNLSVSVTENNAQQYHPNSITTNQITQPKVIPPQLPKVAPEQVQQQKSAAPEKAEVPNSTDPVPNQRSLRNKTKEPETVNQNQVPEMRKSRRLSSKEADSTKPEENVPPPPPQKTPSEVAKTRRNSSVTTPNKQEASTPKKPEQSNKATNKKAMQNNVKSLEPPVEKPVVLLTKLSREEELLALKSVKQFMKTKKLSPGQSNSTSPKRRLSKDSDSANKTTPKNKFFNERGAKRKANNAETSSSKRRRGSQQTTYVESDASGEGEGSDEDFMVDSPAEKPIQKIKKLKNKKIKKEIPNENLSIEDLMDTNTYHHFSRTVDAIFDATEEVDLSVAIEEDTECPAEVLIPLTQLQDLSNEAAKLKRLSAMNLFPPERLVRLLAILERNIVDGSKLLPAGTGEEQDEEEYKLYTELTMERVTRSADASLTALYIMTSPSMPDKVFLEDVIERIVIFLKYQIHNTVYPVFDPAYRPDPKSKDGYAGSIKQKRAHAKNVKGKAMVQLYNKLHESVSLVAELLELQTLTDTIILQVSTLGVSPFFVEGISELQLNALRLVTSVFSRYEKHRQLILEDILASIARLPTSKRSLRNFRLNSEENIQMLTALVLQLIHSVIKLPESENNIKPDNENEDKPKSTEKEKVYIDKDVLIITSYESSMTTAVNFLSVFLKKCGTKNEEMDYRPLFEYFVQDLLSTVNKPEWPASELLLSVLGRILVRNFSDKSVEMTLRVASLDYLGVVAARLRKDAVSSQERKDQINDVIQRVVAENTESTPVKGKKKNPPKRDETQILQKVLLQYLDANTESDPALQFARKFFIAQWYRDAATEIRRSDKSFTLPKDPKPEKPEQTTPSKSKQNSRSRRRSSRVTYDDEEEEEEVEEEEDEDKEKEAKPENDEINAKALALAEERKRFLLTVIKRQDPVKINAEIEEHIDYETAELLSQYLASNRHLSKSFDLYLSQILRVLSETAVAVRTKAMKCLTLVVEADPSILTRIDMQKGVHGRLLDQSTSVREAAVDLLGKFILIRPELVNQYYDMLTERILDTGISVRKRVIKIMKDICLELPDFPKLPEICVKMIRRVNDEDGIKKLVGEVFQSMWFTPTPEKKSEIILLKVKNITQVVETSQDAGLEYFELLLSNLLKNKEDHNYKSIVKSCKQIVDCLVENLLQLEESSQNADGGATAHLVACLQTLHLFSKIARSLVVPHATTIQPYLSMKCISQHDFMLLKTAAQTLELIIPHIEHPSETFLAQIEEDLVKLILRQHAKLLPSCVSCLGAVVNKVTHNNQLVKDCFGKFFNVVAAFKREYEKNPQNPALEKMIPRLLRFLYTVGLFCQHFDFDAMESSPDKNAQATVKQRTFEVVLYFTHHEDKNVCMRALTGLGFLMIRHYEYMLGPEVKALYHYLLTSPMASAALKCQVLKNISSYLVEEETRMIEKDAEWSKMSKGEDLKEMGDVSSGMASTVIQIYLKQVLGSVMNSDIMVRKASLQVIQLILAQGLVHPVQLVPYLVCLCSDDDSLIRNKTDKLLQEIEKKYPGFIQMKAMLGVRMSYQMQQLIQSEIEVLRGLRPSEHDKQPPISRNGFLYSVMRSTRQSRRAFLLGLLKLFDEQARTPLSEQLYLADNIAHFPYQAQDEPLFIMHQLDIMLSVTGSNLLQNFREGLLRPPGAPEPMNPNEENADNYDDDDDDDVESLLERLPEDTTTLQESIVASQGCVLMLYLKQSLKEMYGFTDNKIQQYSPIEAAKVYERPLSRKPHVDFNPETVIEFMRSRLLEGDLDEEGKKLLVEQYIHFKQLMLTIDPSEDDEDGDENRTPALTSVLTVVTVPAEKSADNADGNPPPIEKTKIVIKRRPVAPPPPRRSPKDKVKKKHKKKKRRRVVDSDSGEDNSGSDPDYMDSS